MRKILILIIVLIYFSLMGAFTLPVWAEQTERDMFASVIVNSVFTLVVDNPNIVFGYAAPGKSVELNPATYYNVAKCNSNKGKTWYLKISLTGDISGPTPSIPVESFKWMVFRALGDGAPTEDWQPLTKDQKVAYTSGTTDNKGEDVIIQFKYRLDLPNGARAGYYRAAILYTMTDIP